MASAGVNVARWSALAFGVLYGVSHQSSLRSQQAAAEKKRQWRHQEDLIAKAKAEYLERTLPPERRNGGGVISDPDNPKFDLEAYLKSLEIRK